MNQHWDTERPLWRRMFPFIFSVACILLVLIFVPRFLCSRTSAEQLALAEDGVRRAAVQCYALEGFYPPSLDYLAQHYGVRTDDRRFFIDYRFVAANLMPEISIIPLS